MTAPGIALARRCFAAIALAIWRSRSLLTLAAATAALALLAGCGGSSSTAPIIDPATTVVISGEILVPAANDICHVRGTIQNITPDRTFNVVLHWQALDSAGKIFGSVSLEVNGLKPGETRTFESTGFIEGDKGLFPCSRISTFQRNQTTVNKS